MVAEIDLTAAMANLADELSELLDNEARTSPVFVGIRTSSVWIANRLGKQMGLTGAVGTINIDAFGDSYADDLRQMTPEPMVAGLNLPVDIPVDINGRHVVLVDDVLYTGQTVHAALNALLTHGRPASIALAILVERSGRKLPIHADAVGVMLELSADQYVAITGPEPMSIEIKQRQI